MTDQQSEPRPWRELRSTGLLWLINAAVLHPRGYAIALHWDDDADPATTEPIGWSIVGDGNDPWLFEDSPYVDECFAAVEELFSG